MTAAESVNEEAIELLASAMSSPTRSWNWDHVSHEGDREGWRYEARDVLDQLLPLLRPSDVPHLERRIRESIAGEIEADLAPVNWAPTFRNGMEWAASIARLGIHDAVNHAASARGQVSS